MLGTKVSTLSACPVTFFGKGPFAITFEQEAGLQYIANLTISMPTQQYTNTKYISLERYHLVVSIMLSYMDQIKTFSENLSCRQVKIDKIFFGGGDLLYFAFKCDKFL